MGCHYDLGTLALVEYPGSYEPDDLCDHTCDSMPIDCILMRDEGLRSGLGSESSFCLLHALTESKLLLVLWGLCESGLFQLHRFFILLLTMNCN